MPRGKLHYESYEDGDYLFESWEDPHGKEHHNVTYIGDYEDGPEEGCEACGNPAYPECKSSCPIFDD